MAWEFAIVPARLHTTDTDAVALLEIRVAFFIDFTFALLLKIYLRFRGSFFALS